MERGQQLARALDELDRMQSQPADALAQQAQQSAQQAALAAQQKEAAARALSQQLATLAQAEQGFGQESEAALTGQNPVVELTRVNRTENEDWGQLRKQNADNATTGRRAAVAEEYRRSVETYFRVLAERARRK